MSLSTVSEQLLLPQGLEQRHLFNTLSMLCERKIDFADLYCQASWHEQWILENRLVKVASYQIDQGVGIRTIQGEKTGFAYTDQLTLQELERSAMAARNIVREAGSLRLYPSTPQKVTPLYTPLNPLQTMSSEEKVALLHQMDTIARKADPRVREVTVALGGSYNLILITATDGTLAADIRPLTRLSITVIVEDGKRRESGSSGGGGRRGYEIFFQEKGGETYGTYHALKAVRQALVNLSAVAAPAGILPVVLGSGWPGVLLHEAVGHGLEGDFNRKGTSVFSGKIGQQITSPLCTVVDDGTIPDRRGSLSIDDEGTPSKRNVLIDQGILVGYMHDKLSARLMDAIPTGNGRRESYAHLPMPRMTNTYLLAGKDSPETIISSVGYGIYAPHLGGGQVDITSGKFVFSLSEAYLIENGVVTKPIKGATLIGSGIEAMQKVTMVGNDLALDEGIGICGKEGQSVPVGVGQPTIKLEGMTIGGTR